MSSSKLPNIPSLRRQQLHFEFASLRTNPPPGVYVTLSPNDPALWAGVLFVQKGPYASAILRFQIRFPPTYPDLPPVVTFTTDIFHPLIVPLTTYTFTTGSSETDTVSATDEERLSPGGFSLRHGFPHWFKRGKRGVVPSALSVMSASGTDAKSVKEETVVGAVSGDQTPACQGRRGDNAVSTPQSSRPSTAAESRGVNSPSPGTTAAHDADNKVDVSVLSLLNYIRSSFDDETVLDSIPFEAAGNPSAWHAWRSHRKTSDMCSDRTGALNPESAKSRRNNPQARLPGEWNWEGVWAKRSQNGVQTSFLESVLFGTSGRGTGDELIRFSKLDHELLEKLKEDIIASQSSSTPPV